MHILVSYWSINKYEYLSYHVYITTTRKNYDLTNLFAEQ